MVDLSIEKIESIMHRLQYGERSKVPIEIIPMEEYYLKQMDSVDRIRKLANQWIWNQASCAVSVYAYWLDKRSHLWPIFVFYGTESICFR